MNNLTRTLLGGAALSALTAVPSVAQQKHPAFHVTALHQGRIVNKTARYRCYHHHFTSSCIKTAYTSVSPSDLGKSVSLASTFYKFNSSYTLCSAPKTKIKAHKKSKYGKIKTGTETYSEGCPSGPITFYGDRYKLTDPSGFGQTDHFQSKMSGKFYINGNAYAGSLILRVMVAIGSE